MRVCVANDVFSMWGRDGDTITGDEYGDFGANRIHDATARIPHDVGVHGLMLDVAVPDLGTATNQASDAPNPDFMGTGFRNRDIFNHDVELTGGFCHSLHRNVSHRPLAALARTRSRTRIFLMASSPPTRGSSSPRMASAIFSTSA